MKWYMLELYEAVIDRHLEASLTDIWKRNYFQFEHNFITMTVTRIAAAYAKATVLRIVTIFSQFTNVHCFSNG